MNPQNQTTKKQQHIKNMFTFTPIIQQLRLSSAQVVKNEDSRSYLHSYRKNEIWFTY